MCQDFLLQAIKDIPIYSKVVKELCIKNPGRKKKDPPTVHLVGGISQYISEQPKLAKYGNLGNPVVTITINEVHWKHSHRPRGSHQCYDRYYLGTITVTTSSSAYPNHFELADKNRVTLEGILDDVMVTLASWEYPIDFLVIHSKDLA